MNNFNFVPKEDGTFEIVYEPENPKPVEKKKVVKPAPPAPRVIERAVPAPRFVD